MVCVSVCLYLKSEIVFLIIMFYSGVGKYVAFGSEMQTVGKLFHKLQTYANC